ncbi:conserved hypothetical protein [Mesorhizobium ventifaucium]|uniref:Transposase DDE domain-containing protein n=1 Tax=Mesorhizobium ventifaucium TaxID=666020 RepID=A0ABN8KEB3_9HYPH|nr:conserved hypothetical protein [Mesorhizobium ventifaucium]
MPTATCFLGSFGCTHTEHGAAIKLRWSGGLPSALENRERQMSTLKSKVVSVRAYFRTRLGRLEHVCAHFRSWPRQLSFDF